MEGATKQCCEDIDVCSEQLDSTRTRLTKRRKSLSDAVDVLEENVADLRAEIGDRNETLCRIKVGKVAAARKFPSCILRLVQHGGAALSVVYAIFSLTVWF